VQAYTAARYAAHKDLLLGRVKASRAKNPTYYKAYIAAWKGANRSLRSAVQAKRNDAIAAGGAEVKQFVYKLLSQPNLTCEYCGVDVVGSAHVDHRVPLALGGAHAVDNLQILCPDCNTRKGAKPPDEFFVLLNTAKHFSIEGDLSWR
jgi:5-methylcytosine-specific restriction endonuclease McrA